MIRAAEPEDTAAVEAFLSRYMDTSMFLRANLRRFGACGGDHPYAMTYLLDVDAVGVRGVVGMSTSGMLAVQTPGDPGEILAAVPGFLNGREVAGISGETSQVQRARDKLSIDNVRCDLDEAEQLYALDLDGIVLTSVDRSRIRLATEADFDLIATWRRAYHGEALGAPDAKAALAGRSDAENMIASGQYRILEQAGRAVAMTGFNAAMPDCVQVGAVFVPPELRGRGLARTAVALHLAEARGAGASRAVLFASGAAACRAYEAIGFRRIGSYSLVLFSQPMPVRA